MKNKIAIISTDTGQGCTHFSLMLFKYIKICLRKNVYLISDDIYRSVFIEKETYLYFGDGETKIKDMSTRNNYENIIDKNSYLIVDYGKNYEIDELNKYNRVFCAVSLSFWKVFHLKQFLSLYNQEITKTIEFLYVFGEKEIENYIRRVYRINLKKIPYKADMSYLDMNIYFFMKNILKIY